MRYTVAVCRTKIVVLFQDNVNRGNKRLIWRVWLREVHYFVIEFGQISLIVDSYRNTFLEKVLFYLSNRISPIVKNTRC